MPRKVFTAGEVLAASDVNNFLMDQTVMVFAGTAARGSAIGTAVEGMYTHINDTDALEYYNGSDWVSAIPASTSAILQVVSVIMPDDFSASLVTAAKTAVTGLTASITPSSSSSKILILGQVSGSTTATTWFTHLFRDATEISKGTIEGSRNAAVSGGIGAGETSADSVDNVFFTFLDSPATTSSLTYSIEVSHSSSLTQTVYVNRSQNDFNGLQTRRTVSTITLMEVAG
jgi:hypothetical protein